MTQSSKDDIYEKWSSILNNIEGDFLPENSEILEDFSKSQMTKRVTSQTLALDIVTVQPMSTPSGYGNSSEEMRKIKSDIKAENRGNKIESILEGKEFKEKKIEDHPDYKNGLFFLDYIY